jgi:hypothetical protein
MSTSNMTTMAQLPLPEFNTEEGRKKLDQLFDSENPHPSTQIYSGASREYSIVHKEFVRSILADPSEGLGNYVFGPAYAPFEASSPTYRAPGKYVSVAIELSHPLSRGSTHVTSADAMEWSLTVATCQIPSTLRF